MNNQPEPSSSCRVALLTLGHFISDFYSNFLPGLLPVMISTLGLSLTTGGLLVMAQSFAASAMQPVFGYLIDRSGYFWLILVTLPLSAVFISLAGLSGNQALLFAAVLIAGLGNSLFHPLASSMVGKVTAPANRGLAMAVFIGGGNFGFALAPAAVIFVLVRYGVYSLPWLMLPGILLTFVFYKNGLHRIGNTLAAGGYAPGPAWYKSVSLLKLNLTMGLKSWSQIALPTFLPIWLTQQGHPPTLAGGMLTVYLTAGAIGSFIGGYTVDQLGKRITITSSFAICLPAMYYLIVSDQINIFTWIALCISGGALQGTIPASIVWAQEMIPENAAMASGMMLGLSFGLGGLGTALTGAAADVIGLKPAMLWTQATLAAAIPLACWIPENTPDKSPVNTVKQSAR
ncbi:MAG: MFS transporter [Negativicutes bacterium]|nr:MFS transporter [Negativicutes bacterium]